MRTTVKPAPPSVHAPPANAKALRALAAMLLLTAAPSALAQTTPPDADLAANEEEDFGGEFAPSFDDDDDVGEEEDFGGEFAPSFDDDDDFGEEEDFGGEFAPAFEDDDDFGGEEDFGGEFAPSFDDDVGEEEDFGGEFAPAFEDEEELAGEDVDSGVEDEDDYYMRMWDSLDASDTAEVAEAPPEALVTGFGRVEGVLFDEGFDEPLADATVTIEELDQSVVTGDEGVFFFDVAPGVYTLRIRALGYAAQGFQVEVFENEVASMGRVDMEEDTASAMTMEVEGRMDRQGAAAQLVQRQQAATTRDAISSEQISRTGDSSASDAAQRVVGVTMIDGRYAVVRGLQGRYNSILLNGIPVMILNPNYPAAELDLFPASLLASMAVNKVPTAPLPGDFAGGLLEIETGDFSEDFSLKISAGLSFDTETFAQRYYRYRGGRTDFLGFDDGTRRLPDGIAAGPLRPRTLANPDGYTRDEINALAGDLRNIWNPDERTGLFGTSVGLSMSDTIELSGERALSYRLNLTYKNAPKTRHDIVGGIEGFDSPPFLQQATSHTDEVMWGALGAIRYDFNADHELSFVLAATTLSEDGVDFLTGVNAENLYQNRRELTFSSQRALNLQLIGEHRHLPGSSTLSWAAAIAQGRSNSPDTRYASFNGDPALGEPILQQNSGSSERYYQDMTQLEYTGRFDWSFQLGDGLYRRQLGVGGVARSSNRDYDARRFRYLRAGGLPASTYTGDLEELFAPENLGTLFNFTESTDTEGRDSYDLRQRELAAYAMTDLELNDWFRVVAGARVESYLQDLETEKEQYSSRRHDLDVLPSASLIFRFAQNQALRFAYGASVARPQGHEFAAMLLQDYQRRRQLQGNPDLERTFVHNVDLRWEMFPSQTEVLSATLFYKNFNNHMENVIMSRAGSLQVQNIDEAQSFGLELEAQLDLTRLSPKLRGLALAANFAWTHSQVRLSDDDENIFTSAKRPMADQSPFVLNALLSWDHEASGWQVNLVYNLIGRTLVDVGAVQIPDIYRETVHTLALNASWDINDHWSLDLSIDDLIPTDVRYTYGEFTRDRGQRATAFGIGFGWEY